MEALPEQLQERIDIIIHKLKFIEQKPTVAVITSLDPLLLAGLDLNELAGIAGGTLITGDIDSLYQQNPDIIILMPEGSLIEQTVSQIGELLQIAGFTDLKAVKNNRFYIAEGARILTDTAEQTVNAIELLAEIINPKQFIFGHEGEGWIKFSL
jgi:iron complex transport system substrate-binding protein